MTKQVARRPRRPKLAALLPGYALHCVAHLVFLPYLLANGLARLAKERYKGVALRRLLGGSPPPRRARWVVIVGTALGEARTALKAARSIKRSKGAEVAVWLEHAPVYEALKAKETEADICLAPFNNPLSAAVAMLRWRPRAVIFIENGRNMHLAMVARMCGAKTLLANVNITERRARRYAHRFMSTWRFGVLGPIAVQSEEHKRRLLSIGVAEDTIVVAGPAMAEPIPAQQRDGKAEKWRALLNLNGKTTPVIVGGSTHESEERIVLDAFRIFRERFPSALLVLAPRHTTRKDGADSELRRLSLKFLRRSELPKDGRPDGGIVLLDTQGELQEVYSVATAAFVGGSLIRGVGGHSPLEAAAWGTPITMGPNYSQQEAAVSACMEAGLLSICENAQELAQNWLKSAEQDTRVREANRARFEALVLSRPSAFEAWYDIVS